MLLAAGILWAHSLQGFPSIPPVATFSELFRLKEIPTGIGLPCQVIEQCDPEKDSRIIADTYDFKRVRLGKIRECEMIYEMKEGLVKSITLLLKDEKSRAQALRQARKQFGHGTFSKNELMCVSGWITPTTQGLVSVSLAYSDREPTSLVYIKKMP